MCGFWSIWNFTAPVGCAAHDGSMFFVVWLVPERGLWLGWRVSQELTESRGRVI